LRHCTSHLQAEDFDLSDIFGEYFQNEFDDPMNAYTSSMANYTGGGAFANPMAPGTTMTRPSNAANSAAATSLPTGGIRTAFHYNAPSVVQHEPPVPKKQKTDQETSTSTNLLAAQQYQHNLQQLQVAQQQAMMHPQQVQQAVQPRQHPGAQFLMQQHPHAAVAALAQQSMLQQTVPTGPGGVPLPIGVGIRLGGLAPAMIQSGGMPLHQFSLWGGVPMPGVGPEINAAERRQRNREHAKRSRVRKKFMLEALQGEVNELQKINQWLRMLIQEHIPEHAMKIITECCSTSPLFTDDGAAAGAEGGEKRKDQPLLKSDFTLMHTLSIGQQCFVLSDPKLPDNPIVYASPGFYKLTGYTNKEVLGRNCRFLQGPGTDRQAVEIIRQAVKTGSDATVCLLNYKADGTPFWNQFFLASLRDADNNIVNFVSVGSFFVCFRVTKFNARSMPCSFRPPGWCPNRSGA
jgi:PAS domain S-box-containing protein